MALDKFTHVLYDWVKVESSREECISRKLLWTPASKYRKIFDLLEELTTKFNEGIIYRFADRVKENKEEMGIIKILARAESLYQPGQSEETLSERGGTSCEVDPPERSCRR